eukprot:15339029-Ditylum_brightwellii.AAC.2
MEDYHPIMGMWGDTMQCQFSSRSSMSALTQCANNVPDNWGFESQASGTADVVQLNDDGNNDEPFIQGIKQCLRCQGSTTSSLGLRTIQAGTLLRTSLLKCCSSHQVQMTEWHDIGYGALPL